MKKTLFLLLALLLLLLPGCKHRQPAPTDIQVLRQGSLAPADDDTTPVVYVSVRDQSRHVFGLRAEVERLLRAEKYDITDNPSQAGFIIQASVLEAGITDAASAHRMVEGGYGAPSELSGKGATLVLSDILLVQRRVPSDKRPKRFMLQNVGSRNARGSSQMRTGLLAHREFSVDSGIPALFWPGRSPRPSARPPRNRPRHSRRTNGVPDRHLHPAPALARSADLGPPRYLPERRGHLLRPSGNGRSVRA